MPIIAIRQRANFFILINLIVFSFGIFGEPSFSHPFALFEEFNYRPEAGEGYHAEENGGNGGCHEQRPREANSGQQQEHPPAACPEIIFRLDNDGMEEPYAQEGGKAYDDSCKIHLFNLLCMTCLSGIRCKDTYNIRYSESLLLAINRWDYPGMLSIVFVRTILWINPMSKRSIWQPCAVSGCPSA